LANPTWPAGLPTPIIDGNNYTPGSDNVLRTQFAGGMKVRRRQSSAYEVVAFSLVCNRAQVQTLDNLVVLTLADVLPFDWFEFRDPARSGATYRFRSRPKYAPVQVGRLWRADIELDLLTPFSGSFSLAAAAGVLTTIDGTDITS